MSLPENKKLTSHEKHRTYMSVAMIVPAVFGLLKFVNASLNKVSWEDSLPGIIIFSVSFILLLVFTSVERLVLKPTLYVQKDDVRTKLYVVHAYPERHWERYTAEDIVWTEVIKIFPCVYVAVGEPFKGSDSPFIRRHKDFN